MGVGYEHIGAFVREWCGDCGRGALKHAYGLEAGEDCGPAWGKCVRRVFGGSMSCFGGGPVELMMAGFERDVGIFASGHSVTSVFAIYCGSSGPWGMWKRRRM
jgi:hypothetical protein